MIIFKFLKRRTFLRKCTMSMQRFNLSMIRHDYAVCYHILWLLFMHKTLRFWPLVTWWRPLRNAIKTILIIYASEVASFRSGGWQLPTVGPSWVRGQPVWVVHRVGRVLSFFSSRRNWYSPNPSPAGESAPVLGGGHTRWRVRGWENPNSDEGTYTVVLFIYTYFVGPSILDWAGQCGK
jgi:hypothetical protein